MKSFYRVGQNLVGLFVISALVIMVVLTVRPMAQRPAATHSEAPRIVYGPDQHGIICVGYGGNTMRCVATETRVIPLFPETDDAN